MAAFESQGRANCHNGPMFSDYAQHVVGVPDDPKLTASDRIAGRATSSWEC
ncbi:MAG: hypothetical protein ABI051_10870 [Vicinamibacterales bacterium]